MLLIIGVSYVKRHTANEALDQSWVNVGQLSIMPPQLKQCRTKLYLSHSKWTTI